MVQIFGLLKMFELVAKHYCSYLISTLTEKYSETLVVCLFVGSCAAGIAESTELPKTFPSDYNYCKEHGCDRDHEAKCLVILLFSFCCQVYCFICSSTANVQTPGHQDVLRLV